MTVLRLATHYRSLTPDVLAAEQEQYAPPAHSL